MSQTYRNPGYLDRVRSNPRWDVGTGEAQVEAFGGLFRKRPDAPPLKPVQALALMGAAMAGPNEGIMGIMGVGVGKTLTTLLLGHMFQADRSLLLLPASMVNGFNQQAIYWDRYYHICIPRVLAYEHLSTRTGIGILDSYGPQVIFADEGHRLRHHTAARTKRLARYLEAHPRTRFCPMSGTLTTDSVYDYAHLASWALRERSFLPTHHVELNMLRALVDVGGEPDDDSIRWGECFIEAVGYVPEPDEEISRSVRRALRQLMRATPGVIVSTGSSYGGRVRLEPFNPGTATAVNETLTELRDKWEITDKNTGDVTLLMDASQEAAMGRHVSSGFRYVPDWPVGPDGAPIVDVEWLEARKAWGKSVRSIARRGLPGLETEALIREYVGAFLDGQPAAFTWAGTPSHDFQVALYNWRKVADRDPPPIKTVWISKEYINAVVRFARAHGPIGIFVSADATLDALREAGLPCFGQGDGDVPEGTPIAVMKIRIHGDGKNYQWWQRLLIAEVPPNGKDMQQVIGRIARQGQRADEVEIFIASATAYHVRAFEAAKADAVYIEDSMADHVLNVAIDNVTQEGE